jgi:hypothetical protein
LLAQPRFPQHSTGWPAGWPAAPPPLPDTHGARLGATISGRPLPLGAPGARPVRPGIIVGSPIVGGPIVGNPGLWLPYSVTPQPAPVYVINNVTPPPAIVSVNPDYKPEVAKPVMTEYYAESKPYDHIPDAGQGKLKVYLIALRDGTLRQAVAFWREDATLHFVLPDHKQSSVAMDQLDREASVRFNRERGLELRLPD